MLLNFHGHILPGDGSKLLIRVDANVDNLPGNIVPMAGTILYKMHIDPDLAHWCYNRLQLYGGGEIGSAESVILRTAVRRLVEALYSNWELVTTLLPVKTVEAAIEEFHLMAEISKEYPDLNFTRQP